jgi:phosphotriesterase-related protein
MGRDVAAMQRISAASGVAIILATGLYTRPASPAISSVKALASEFVRELTDGIGETGVRAQVIGEIGTGAWPIGQFERDLFDAAALAHLETGAPIATHTHGGKYARWQLDRLTSRGVPADRIVIGHLDEGIVFGERYLAGVARLALRGCFLGFDTVGITYYSPYMRRHQPSDEARAMAVKQLAGMGVGSQLLLAHDICRPDHLLSNVDDATAMSFVSDNPLRWLSGT